MEVEQTFIHKLWSSLAILSTDLNFCTKMLKFQIMFVVIWNVLLFPEWLYYILQPTPPPPTRAESFEGLDLANQQENKCWELMISILMFKEK